MTMRKFEQKFTIHPVGQGLFYSGEIRFNNAVKFRMVFDCGSLPQNKSTNEVKYYRENNFNTDKILDLLVISHFDADHINQIKTLLGSDVKVKRLVMPFLNFEERLFLAARFIHNVHDSTESSEDDQTVNFILDPLTTLAENFGDDTEYYFIENDPDNPIPSDEESTNDDTTSEINEGRFVFGFDTNARIALTREEKSSLIPGRPIINTAYKVKDSNKGKLSVPDGRLIVMDFLFYKKNIGLLEDTFYKKVKEIFYAKCDIGSDDTEEVIMNKILEKIKPMKGSSQVEEIFREAVIMLGITSFTITKTELYDLNTTALCMMHRNLKSISQLIGLPRNTDTTYYYPRYANHNIYIINIMGITSKRIELSYPSLYHHRYFRDEYSFYRSTFPNALLTSDSLLKTETDVNEFLNKYMYYWDYFWLFQIPHHGSEKNADKKLLSRLFYYQSNFINYGTDNSHGHPSGDLINDMISTGISQKLIPINEFHGVSFELCLEH